MAEAGDVLLWPGTYGPPPAGPPSPPEQLSLSYNGAGPVACAVLKPLGYNPAAGGLVLAMLPDALTGIGFDAPAFVDVNAAGVIQAIVPAAPNPGGGALACFGPTKNIVSMFLQGLTLAQQTGYPGDTPGTVAAHQGMVLHDGSGGLWVCRVSYNPVGPVHAVWTHHQAADKVQNFAADGAAGPGLAICDATAGLITLTISAFTAECVGDTVAAIKTDASINAVAITPASGLINGNGIYNLSTQGQAARCNWDGTNWWVI